MTDDEFTFVNNHQLMENHVQQDLVNNLPYFYKMGVVFEKFCPSILQCITLSTSLQRVSILI